MALLTLLLILAASVAVYLTLVRRHTIHRRQTATWEWAVNRGFKFGPTGTTTLAGLDHWPHHRPDVIEHLRRGPVTIVRVRSFAEDGAVESSSSAAPRYWNLLLRETADVHATVALRPATATGSVIDLFELQLFPKLSNETRFSVFGSEAIAARKLASGPAAALIPRDIGLVRTGKTLILDFTARPFDTVEFTRIDAIAGQLVEKL